MTALLSSVTPQNRPFPYVTPENQAFARDTIDFFSGHRAGHMSKWLYSTPLFPGDRANGADMWAKVVTDAKMGSPYYVFLAERSIIQNSSHKLSPIFDRPTRFIDLGPGSVDAVENKVLPVISCGKTKVRDYLAIDICAENAVLAARHVKARHPLIKTAGTNKNFFEDRFSFGPRIQQEVAAFFGLTLCNLAIDPRVPNIAPRILESYMMRLRSHFTAERGVLLLTQDTNQDEDRLCAAYFALSEHFMPLLHLIERDLAPTPGYDADGFTLDVEYFPETCALSICFVARKNMDFEISGTPCSVKKGNRYYFHNAYKFGTGDFLKIMRNAGLNVIDTFSEQDNPCVLHALKAV